MHTLPNLVYFLEMCTLARSNCIGDVEEGEGLFLEAAIQAKQLLIRCSSFSLQSLVLHLCVLLNLDNCSNIISICMYWVIGMIR